MKYLKYLKKFLDKLKNHRINFNKKENVIYSILIFIITILLIIIIVLFKSPQIKTSTNTFGDISNSIILQAGVSSFSQGHLKIQTPNTTPVCNSGRICPQYIAVGNILDVNLSNVKYENNIGVEIPTLEFNLGDNILVIGNYTDNTKTAINAQIIQKLTIGPILPSPNMTKRVSLTDNHSIINLNIDESFSLNLGIVYSRSVNIGDQSIISRVPNMSVIRGSQGIFKAHKVGSTVLRAVGTPL